MERDRRRNFILLGASGLLLTCLFLFYQLNVNEGRYRPREKQQDSILGVEETATQVFQRLREVDSLVKLERARELADLEEKRRIKDSITLERRRLVEIKRKTELEKKEMKEKYEKHIDVIYKVNCISRGGPEDTILLKTEW